MFWGSTLNQLPVDMRVIEQLLRAPESTRGEARALMCDKSAQVADANLLYPLFLKTVKKP